LLASRSCAEEFFKRKVVRKRNCAWSLFYRKVVSEKKHCVKIIYFVGE
jgi:hypothetical protein